MKSDTKSPAARSLWLPYFILISGLVLTAVVTFFVAQNLRFRARQEFETAIFETQSDIRSRMEAYIALLRGGAGLFAVNRWVTAEEFRIYVERLHVAEFYPGVQGIGFAYRVTPETKDAFFTRLDEQGLTDFEIRPSTKPPILFPIVYLEPLDARNRAALGYDMFSDPARRLAMERARDEGEPALSGKVTLVQEIAGPKQPGLLIYVPIYSTGKIPATIAERRKAIEGYVYSPFRAHDLFRGILDQTSKFPLNMEIFDGRATEETNLLFREINSPLRAALQNTAILEIAGHAWTFRFWSPESTRGAATWLPLLIAAIGIALSFILFYFTFAEAKVRHRLEQTTSELRESETRFRLLFEQSPITVQLFAPDGSARGANHAWENLWHTERKYLEGYNILKDPQLKAKGLAPYLERAFAGEPVAIPPVCYDPAEIGKPGQARWVEAYLYPVKVDGKLQEVVLLLEDVTERRKSEQALRESEERFRLIVERARDYAIFMLDNEGKVSAWNPGAERILGYSEKEILGQSGVLFFTPEDRQNAEDQIELRTATETGQALDERWHLRKDGSRFWASGYMIALRDASGNLRGFAKIMRDMTERKKAEEEVQRLNRDLERRVTERTAALQDSYEQMETFTYTVAHDLRAPLRAMQGFAAVLLDDYAEKLDETGQDFVRRIVRASQRMDTLIQDLLAYSQLSRTDLHFSTVDLRSAIDAAIGTLSEEITQRKAVISVEGVFPPVTGHRSTIEHIVANLVSNAMKFVGKDVQPRVIIRGERRENRARLWVEDNGIGIAPDYQQRIFRIFERLHGVESYPGTGMGLALVKKGVERMKGSVGVESQLGHGSRFWIELPAAEKK